MNLSHVQNLLPRYLEDDLPAAEVRAVEAHLAVCRTCRAELAYLERISTLLRRRVAVPLPGLWEGIAARIQPDKLWKHFEWAGKRLVPLLAAAVLILAVWGSFGRQNSAVSLEDFLRAQWTGAGVETVVVADTQLSRDDVLALTAQVEPSQPQR